MNKEIFNKYLKNRCSNEEFEEVAKWVTEDENDGERKKWSFDNWEQIQPDNSRKDDGKFSALLNKIHHEINLKSSVNSTRETKTLPIVLNWLSRAAAVLFIPLLGTLLYLLSVNDFSLQEVADNQMRSDSIEIVAPICSKTVVDLSDGTNVTLNYGSRIKYPHNFSGDTREVILEGEAYFDVAHNPQKPFIVKTRKLNVKVLGTEFNVRAYPTDEFIATTLVRGKVEIDKSLENGKLQKIGQLVPGQHVSYDLATGKISSGKGGINKYIAWKKGEMVFNNTPIDIVVQELSLKFNVDFEIDDDIKDLTYSVTFADDPLFLILDLMTEITPVKYHRIPREKLSDGSFTKQKIRIEKR